MSGQEQVYSIRRERETLQFSEGTMRQIRRRHATVHSKRSILIAAAALAAMPIITHAATDTWSGGGVNGNWNNAANWDTLPVATDVLQFAGVTNLTTNNDFTANTQFNGINFLSGAGAFTLGGNAVILGGDINQNSGANQTVTLGIVLDGATSNVNVTGGGSLSLGSVVLGNAASNTVGSLNASTLNINNTVSATSFNVRTDTAT